MRRYQDHDFDSARWDGFEFRPGDIVVVAPSKSGTTWTQLLVALLVFDGPEFPEPLGKLSPWLDHKIIPTDEVFALLEAQDHRRIIKTHTPLDGLPQVEGVSYVCVARDPRDAFVSMQHHSANLDRDRMHDLLGTTPQPRSEQLGDPVDRFIDDHWEDGSWTLDWLTHFVTTFWEHRHLPNVELFHFADYVTDLPVEVERLAAFLGIACEDPGALAAHARLDVVKGRADQVAPEAHLGMWHDTNAFFRAGSVGDHGEVFDARQLERYDQRVDQLVGPELARWLHGGRRLQSP